ncbi:MAG: spore coat protein [Firmicutes bacterium]|nr:spore coat protein [Bacillota bacterium]
MSERSGEPVSPSRLPLYSKPAAALHQTIMGLLAETHDAAREAYNLMFKKGWYKLGLGQRPGRPVDQRAVHQLPDLVPLRSVEWLRLNRKRFDRGRAGKVAAFLMYTPRLMGANPCIVGRASHGHCLGDTSAILPNVLK